jgi:hypothetical protein
MTNLRQTIESLAAQFATNILDALRSASIDELVGVSGSTGGAPRRGRARGPAAAAVVATETAGAPRRRGRGGRLGRRTASDIGKMIESIVGLLQKNGDGLRAEQIRAALGVESKELPRPLAEAVNAGLITKTGQKRATTYFAGGGEASASPKRRSRRPAGRSKKR